MGGLNLAVAELDHTKVTEAGLKELTGLQSLQGCFSANNEVDDAGLEQLTALKSLLVLPSATRSVDRRREVP